MLLLFLNGLLADLPQTRAGGRRDRGRALADGPRRPASLLARAQKRLGACRLSATAGCRRLRRAAGHRHRDRACDHAVLPPQLVAARRGARPVDGPRAAGTASTRYPDARELPGLVVYPLGGAAVLRQRRRSSASRSAELVRERHAAWVSLQCEAITDIDVTAAEMLEQLDKELNATGIHMAFAEMRTRLQDLVSGMASMRRWIATTSTRASRQRSRPSASSRTQARRSAGRTEHSRRAPRSPGSHGT